ncbi:MAG: diguanylate cyclase response regulator, partial [Betaproteobacteria bacterium]|nr:diguanylate cyclase response regulator [Betaproteobacteria bacterium]
MSDQEGLKQHFAQRVIHQAREVLELWQQLQRSEWSDRYHSTLTDATLRLRRFAERFEQTEHSELAIGIEDCLSDIRDNRGRLSSESISTLSQLIYRLARTGLRHSDPHNQMFLPPLSKPIYIALQDVQRAQHLVRQLDFFSMTARAFANDDEFRAAMNERHPAAIVMEVDFNGAGEG